MKFSLIVLCVIVFCNYACSDCNCETSRDTCKHYIKLHQRGKRYVVYYPDMTDTIYAGPNSSLYSINGTNRIYDDFTQMDSTSNICYCACKDVSIVVLETTAIVRSLQ